ncbi:DUF2207 domain-containing protein [Frondihabitans cladoniiphilus]|uniref:Membrane protein DUF2207 n=1 Tax=Frondihabitans cladoniiphilus TaxID=715785 RepID=A0ABP8VPM0_9MICO
MKKFAAALVIALGLLFAVAAPARADVNDFRFSSMKVAYSLGRDDHGHSTLRTVETLTAVFPQTNQNHGIERALIDDYDGHPTDLHVVSVTDASGRARPFDIDREDGDTTVTSRASGFVHGSQTYVITYEQTNVTLQNASSGNDEFYWDVNGTDWGQPFGRVDATVTVEPALADSLTGDLRAFQGREGSRTPATIDRASTSTIRASASDLGAHENLTLAVGFRAGTFTPRDDSVLAAPWPLLSMGGGLLALLAVVAAVVARRGPLRDAPGRPTIVAEYEPPEGIGLPFAGHFVGRASTAPELLSLAVRGALRLVEKSNTGRLTKRAPAFAMRYETDARADADDLVFLHALFGDPLVAGKERDVISKNRNAIQRISTLGRSLPQRAVAEGYRLPVPRRLLMGILVPAAVGFLVAVVFGAVSIGASIGGAWPVVALFVGVVAAGVAPVLVVRRPLTARGAEVRDHLKGLELYVKLAEADRLAFLQSPEGAQRVAAGDEAWLRLNEELLPWAALFGAQKRWSEELGAHYEERGAAPGWYSGQSTFTPAIFAASMGGFSSSTASAFSSSTGGSTGGGFSGGGGGGGGGGGV